jgi:hypothetical protein
VTSAGGTPYTCPYSAHFFPSWHTGDVERVALGFCARTGSAVAVAITPTSLLGRWTVDLTDGRVPDQVFHAVQGWERAAAVRYVEDAIAVVRDVAARRLRELLAGLPDAVAVGVVTGDRELAFTAARVLESHPLMHAAEGQLYRDALLDAAAEQGMAVTALPRGVADERLRAATPVAETVQRLGELAGPPWRKDHKRATAAALAALEPATAAPTAAPTAGPTATS